MSTWLGNSTKILVQGVPVKVPYFKKREIILPNLDGTESISGKAFRAEWSFPE